MDGFKVNNTQVIETVVTYGFKIKDICDRYLLTIETQWLLSLYGVRG